MQQLPVLRDNGHSVQGRGLQSRGDGPAKHGDDEFGPLSEWKPLIESLPGEKRMVVIEASSHFFDGAG